MLMPLNSFSYLDWVQGIQGRYLQVSNPYTPAKMALGYILGGVMTWGLDPIFPTSPEQFRGFQPPSGAL